MKGEGEGNPLLASRSFFSVHTYVLQRYELGTSKSQWLIESDRAARKDATGPKVNITREGGLLGLIQSKSRDLRRLTVAVKSTIHPSP